MGGVCCKKSPQPLTVHLDCNGLPFACAPVKPKSSAPASSEEGVLTISSGEKKVASAAPAAPAAPEKQRQEQPQKPAPMCDDAPPAKGEKPPAAAAALEVADVSLELEFGGGASAGAGGIDGVCEAAALRALGGAWEARSLAQLAALYRLAHEADAAESMPLVRDGFGGDAAAARASLRRLCEKALSVFASEGAPTEEQLADICGLVASGDAELCRRLADALLKKAGGSQLADPRLLGAVARTLERLPPGTFSSSDWGSVTGFCAAQLDPAGAAPQDADSHARLELVSAVLAALEAAGDGAGEGWWRAEAAARLAQQALVAARSDFDRFGDAVRRAKAAGRVAVVLFRAGRLVAEGVATCGAATVIDIVLLCAEHRNDAAELLREVWGAARVVAGADQPPSKQRWFARARLLGTLAARGAGDELEALLEEADGAALAEAAACRELALALCAALFRLAGAGWPRAAAHVYMLARRAEALTWLRRLAASKSSSAAAAAARAAAKRTLRLDPAALAAADSCKALPCPRLAPVPPAAPVAPLAGGGPSELLRMARAAAPAEERLAEALQQARAAALAKYEAEEAELARKAVEEAAHLLVYVPAKATAEAETRAAPDAPRFDLEEALAAFAERGEGPAGRGPYRSLLLSGDSGCSKTTVLRRLHRRLLAAWRPGRPFPVFLSLPSIGPHRRLADALLLSAGLPADQSSPVAELPKRGGLLVLLDAYDEGTDGREGKPPYAMDADLPRLAARLVVACRATFVPCLGARYRERFALDEASGARSVCEAWTCPFSPEQIKEYVDLWVKEARPDGDAKWHMETLREVHGLLDVIRTPFVLSIALRALPKIKANSAGGAGRRLTEGDRVLLRDVYDAFVAGWLEREEKRWASQGGSAALADECRRLCIEIARLMDRARTTAFSVPLAKSTGLGQPISLEAIEALPDPERSMRRASEILKKLQRSKEAALLAAPLDAERSADAGARGQEILYRFLHASLKEYFIANGIERLKGIEVITELGRRSYVDDSAIVRFLAERARRTPEFREVLWEVVRRSRDVGVAIDSHHAIAACNALTVLNAAGESFAGADLRGVRAPGADLYRMEAAGADLREADLSGACLQEANLSGADLRGAVLENVRTGLLPLYTRRDGETASKSSTNAVNAVAFSPLKENGLVATGWEDGTLALLRAGTAEEFLVVDTGVSITGVAFTPSGDALYAAGADGFVRLRSASDGSVVREWRAHNAPVLAIALAKDGKLLVTGSENGTVRVWMTTDMRLQETYKGHEGRVFAVAVSPKDAALVASGGEDGSVRLWQNGEEVAALRGSAEPVKAVAFSPDGVLVAAAGCDNTVRLWSVQDGRLVREMRGHHYWIEALAFAPDGSFLASGSWDKTIRVWRLPEGALQAVLSGHTANILGLDVSPDGSHIVSGALDKTVRLWGTATSAGERRELEPNGTTRRVTCLAVAAEGACFAAGSYDGNVRIRSAIDGTALRLLRSPAVEGAEKLPAAVGASSAPLEVNAVAISAEGDLVAVAGTSRWICLWKGDGTVLSHWHAHRDAIWGLSMSRDGNTLASCSADGTVRVWRAAGGFLLREYKGHEGRVFAVAVSPKDAALVASGGEDGSVRLWQNGEEVAALRASAEPVKAVAFSPDGALVAAAGCDNTVRLWGVADGRLRWSTSGHSWWITSLAFSPDGSKIASSSFDRSVRVWGAEDGAPLWTLRGHISWVFAVGFTPDGTRVISSGNGNIFRFWRLGEGPSAEGACVRRVGLGQQLEAVGARVDETTKAGEVLRRVLADRAEPPPLGFLRSGRLDPAAGMTPPPHLESALAFLRDA
eukprot:tig00001231_g7653.t1